MIARANNAARDLLARLTDEAELESAAIGDVRGGKGLIAGAELVSDRTTKAGFPADQKVGLRLRRDMETAAERLDYERAATLRDRLQAIEAAVARQGAVDPDGKDRDVLAVASAGGVAMLGVLYVRDGHVVAAKTWPQRENFSPAAKSPRRWRRLNSGCRCRCIP